MVEQSSNREKRWEREALPGFEFADCEPTELYEARQEIPADGRFGIAVPDSDEEFLRRL